MKIAVILTLIALGVIGCKTSDENAGAPPPGYETEVGGLQNSTSDTARPVEEPNISWQRYRYMGITRVTPP